VASLNQSAIDAADLGRNVALNVERLALSLQLAAERLKRAQEAVGFYDKTIDSEQQKLKAGDSTLVDTVLTEQQTTSARLAYVQAQQEFATTLARLRFESGQLVLREGEQARITGDSLATVPAPIRVQ
jgi:outer membrane protein TolC